MVTRQLFFIMEHVKIINNDELFTFSWRPDKKTIDYIFGTFQIFSLFQVFIKRLVTPSEEDKS